MSETDQTNSQAPTTPTASPAQPTPAPAPAPAPMQPQPMQYNAPTGNVPPDKSTLCLVLSIIEIVVAGGLLAIIPLVFSIQYKSAYAAGDMVTAEAKHKTARTLLIVFGILGIICDIFAFSQLASGSALL